jgi:dephospho-CoA kinase
MIIGLTGGIGAGKSLVSKILVSMSYPVFNSDAEAKKMVEKNSVIRANIIKILGKKAYTAEGYNRPYVASIVFNDNEKLEQLNAIIHPAVRQAFKEFSIEHAGELVFNEAAILFETGAYKTFDKTILVVADEEIRLKRVLDRDKSSKEEIQARFSKQWNDNQKMKLADFIIDNNEKESVLLQIQAILKSLNS